MKDQYQRTLSYMRISLTDRCNYRCEYCGGIPQLSHDDILSYEEILEICRCAIQLGIHTFKITGGEPLVRKDVLFFIKQLKELEGVQQVTLTTNGSLLSKEDLQFLKDIHIDGINFSLDTIDEHLYQEITQSHELKKVMKNILLAKKLGVYVKINCVLLEKLTINHIQDLMDWCFQHDIILRFIELMPMGYKQKSLYNREDIFYLCHSHVPIKERFGNGPATYYLLDDHIVGFIEPLSHKFCETCNRLRLSSTGYLQTCLFHKDGVNLRYQKDIKSLMKKAMFEKPKEHFFEKENTDMKMFEIGG